MTVYEEEFEDNKSSLERRRASTEVHESMLDDSVVRKGHRCHHASAEVHESILDTSVVRKGHHCHHYHYRVQVERNVKALAERTAQF